MPNISKEALQKHWVHSNEEDTDTEMVLRPAGYDFPLTRRPRESFELKPDGTLIKGKPSPSDSLQESKGKWELEDDDKLAFYNGSASEPSRKLKIASVDKTRLIVKK